MATAAQWDMEAEEPRGSARSEGARNTWRDRTEAYKLRAIPNEDVYFYSKKINNSRLVKPLDPVKRRRAWGVLATGLSFAVILILMMLPHLMNTMAGMQIQKLEAENSALAAEHAQIRYQESLLMNPERMKAIARAQNMVEPGPEQVHYLNRPTNPGAKEVLEAKLK